MPWIISILVIGGIGFLIYRNIFIVPQASQYVIERLGKYHRTANAGLQLKFPFIDSVIKKVSVKEGTIDTPPQRVITKDNVTLAVDSIVYYYVFDSKSFCYGAVDPLLSLANLATTVLRNVLGGLTLDESLTSRDKINAQLTQLLDQATDKWGIRVTRVELKDILPPAEIKSAMDKEMIAERDKRQKILDAEAHKLAVITRAEGEKQAAILEAEGFRESARIRAEGEAEAIERRSLAEATGISYLKQSNIDAMILALKKYEALSNLADGQATKLIIPSDVVDMTTKNTIFSETTELGGYTKQGVKFPVKPKQDTCCD